MASGGLAKLKGAKLLMAGLKNGEVSKLVDDMEKKEVVMASEEPLDPDLPVPVAEKWRPLLKPWVLTPEGLAFLGKVDLFRTLSSGDKQELAQELQVLTCQDGDQLWAKGDVVKDVFVVLKGEVHATVDGEYVKEFETADFFGHDAVVHGRSNVDLFCTVNDTVLLVLDASIGSDFDRVVGPLWDSYIISYEAQFAEQLEKVFAVVASPLLEEGVIRDQTEDYDDELDGELEDMEDRAFAPARRKAIHNEPCVIKADWIAPKYIKLASQRKMIVSSLVGRSLLSPLLLADNMWAVVDAFWGPRHLHRGEVLCSQGQIVDSMEPAFFILESGTLESYRLMPKVPFPGELRQTFSSPGECFGELEVLHNVPRTMSIVAKENSVVFQIERETFNNCIFRANSSMQQRRQRALRGVSTLNCLKSDEICRLAEVLKTRAYNKDETIVSVGQEADELIIIEVGSVVGDPLAGASKGAERKHSPGESFGEVNLLRTGAVIKVTKLANETPTRVAVLQKDTFERLFGPLAEMMAERRRKDSKEVRMYSSEQTGLTSGEGSEMGIYIPYFSEHPGTPGLPQNSGFPQSPRSPRSPRWMSGGDLASPMFSPRRGAPGQGGALFRPMAADRPGIFLAWYPRRTQEVGGVQGPMPLAPGESFSVTVRSRGTFCEIGLGLAPLRVAQQPASATEPAAPLAITDGHTKGASMVGWHANEVGFHGDHGRWYHAGKSQGDVSPQWEIGDVVTCGLTPQGCVYFLRTGYWIDKTGEPMYYEKRVAETEYPWSIAHAYPTVTFYSAGAELVVDLSTVDSKSTHEVAKGGKGQVRTENHFDLMDRFKHTSIAESKKRPGAGVHFLERWLGFGVFGSCGEVESAAGHSKQ